MNQDNSYLIELLNAAIHGLSAPEPGHAPNWPCIFEEAYLQNIAAIIFSATEKLPAGKGPPSELLERWREHTYSVATRQMLALSSLFSVLETAGQAGFTPVVFKGPVLAELYPEPFTRFSGDIDILIDPGDEAALLKIFNRLGCAQQAVHTSDSHEHTYTLGNDISYEVHTGLWEKHDRSEKGNILESMGIAAAGNFIRRRVMGISVLTLGDYEQFIYMLYHMAKHLIINGIGIRFLSDLTLYYNVHADDIPADRLWNDIDKLGYRSFCENIFLICVRHFNMRRSVFPADLPHDASAANMIFEDMWEGGVFGRRTAVRELSGRILKQYFKNEDKKPPKTRLGLLFAFLFPKGPELARIDSVTLSPNKHAARFQRIVYFAQRWLDRKKKKLPTCSMKDRIGCSMKRIKMLEKIGLLK
jgi:hypothetical protein